MQEVSKLLYDRRSAAEALSISVRSLDYLIGRQEFEIRRVGRKVLITAGSLRRFAAGNHYGDINQTVEKVAA